MSWTTSRSCRSSIFLELVSAHSRGEGQRLEIHLGSGSLSYLSNLLAPLIHKALHFVQVAPRVSEARVTLGDQQGWKYLSCERKTTVSILRLWQAEDFCLQHRKIWVSGLVRPVAYCGKGIAFDSTQWDPHLSGPEAEFWARARLESIQLTRLPMRSSGAHWGCTN